jgi:histone H3/H4
MTRTVQGRRKGTYSSDERHEKSADAKTSAVAPVSSAVSKKTKATRQQQSYRTRHSGLPMKCVRRLADRSGVIRISEDGRERLGTLFEFILNEIASTAAAYAAYSRRGTISRKDVVNAIATLRMEVLC